MSSSRLPDLASQSKLNFFRRQFSRKESTQPIPLPQEEFQDPATFPRQNNTCTTPYLAQKRDLQFTTGRKSLKSQETSNQLLASLTQQITYLQKQLQTQQQSMSFIKKITPDSQVTCMQCDKLKDQLECTSQNLKKESKVSQEQRITIEKLENMLKQLRLKNINKPTTAPQDLTPRQSIPTLNPLGEKISKVYQHSLFYAVDHDQIQFCLKQTHQQMEKQIEDLQIKKAHFEELLKQATFKIKELEKKVHQQDIQMNNCLKNAAIESEMNDHLKSQISLLEQAMKNLQAQYDKLQGEKVKSVLPLEIHHLKKTIDKNIENGDAQKLAKLESQVKLLERDKFMLQQQICNNDTRVALQAKQKNIENHLVKIEALEMELYLSLRCSKCKDLLKDSLTCIPCGHSYCMSCHRGHKLSCDVCDKTENTVALYRNHQFDELIKVYYQIQNSKNFIKNCLLQV